MRDLRAAIASSDGKNIDEHFGQTPAFYIYRISERGYRLEELIRLTGAERGQCGAHDEHAMAERLAEISDCDIVLAARIGNGVQKQLRYERIKFFELPGASIPSAMERLVQYHAKQGVYKAPQYFESEAREGS